MGKFASAKNAYGISDRSGFRYKRDRMKKEWNGSLVGWDEWEPKQPQLNPLPKVGDPQAILNPRPDRAEPLIVSVGVPTPENNPFVPVRSVGQVGTVTVSTT
tara:strand:- start:562 stop:867 length:306 start_codon:yes stop_codon:yes gene_type:complete